MSNKGFLHTLISTYRNRQARQTEHKQRLSAAGLTWTKEKYLKHVKPGTKRYHTIPGGPVAFVKGNELLHGLHELFVEQVYKQQLPVNATILDCGANIGLSVIYLKSICPTATIIAFEPDPQNFQLLQENIAAHKLQNIDLRKEAVWVKDEKLYFENQGSQASQITNEQSNNTIEVTAIRLRDILDKHIDFLKMDIEGAEYGVIKDCADRLHLVDNLFIEYHGKFHQANELVEMLDIVTQHGFSIYIKEAANVYAHPFVTDSRAPHYDVQLNIFCKKGLGKQ